MLDGWFAGPGASEFCGRSTDPPPTSAPARAASSARSSASRMLLVDTGPLVAFINRKDPDHEACAALFDARTDGLLVTPYVLTEACYLIGKYVGAGQALTLLP